MQDSVGMEDSSSSTSAGPVYCRKERENKCDDEESSRSKEQRHCETNGAAATTTAAAAAAAAEGALERHRSLAEGSQPQDSRNMQQPRKAATTPTAVARSPSATIDEPADGLSKPGRGARERLGETDEQADERLARISAAVRVILECLGEDADREGLLATPERYAKAMLFLTEGYQQNVPDLVHNAIFTEGHGGMVLVKGIEVSSLCEHHLVPFFGKMHIGYIPNRSVIGLSKLARIATMFARRLQIQERLTRDVADAIVGALAPGGVAVVMEASHLCMLMRGVEKTKATTTTSCFLGCFESDGQMRSDFLRLIGVDSI